jgi:hypothetical protein
VRFFLNEGPLPRGVCILTSLSGCGSILTAGLMNEGVLNRPSTLDMLDDLDLCYLNFDHEPYHPPAHQQVRDAVAMALMIGMAASGRGRSIRRAMIVL